MVRPLNMRLHHLFSIALCLWTSTGKVQASESSVAQSVVAGSSSEVVAPAVTLPIERSPEIVRPVMKPARTYITVVPALSSRQNAAPANSYSPPSQQVDESVFRWSAAIAPGKAVALRGFAGSIHASLSESETLQVEAVKSGPAEATAGVRIAVSENAEGILICAIPGQQEMGKVFEKESCSAPSLPKHVHVDFKLLVPAGVALVVHNVTGDVIADSLRSRVDAVTGTGNVSISTTDAITSAQTGSGSLDLSIGKLWTGLLTVKTGYGNIRLVLPRNVSFQPSGKGKTLITGSGPVQMKGMAVSESQNGNIGQGPKLIMSTLHGSVTVGKSD
jgi:hypothetical protein